ncbi:MAG: recombinase family protein [Clostridia bacterium]|nr:recombinase family protein [Clostridia bacterium]
MEFDNMIIEKLLSIYKPEEIGKYIRLSREDRNKQNKLKDESESVTNQRSIINNFIDYRGNIGKQCSEFVDDGKTGTNFERPGWKKLIEEIENGKIKVVITKNLSRLGRSNFECGYYMDYYFPMMNVRYFSVQEDIDTGNSHNSSNEYAPLTNFMNEKYSRDLSRNIKNSKRLRQEAGDYVGSNNTPFGYIRDPKNKRHLIIEEETAKIVLQIYEWYIETESLAAVRKLLYENNIPTPAVTRGLTSMTTKLAHPCEWTARTIKYILTSQMYIGNMEQHKYEKKNFRDKSHRTKKEDWIIVEGTHEPIIDRETFEKVQNLIKANYKRASNRPPELFTGLLKCYDCKSGMSICNCDRTGKDGTHYHHQYTQCNYYRHHKRLNVCSLHSMNYIQLEADLLEELEKICKKFIKLINYEKITKQKQGNISDYGTTLLEKINKLKIEITKIEKKSEKTYMDRLDEIISVETYKQISSKFEEQKKKLQEELEEVESEYKQYNEENTSEKVLEAKELATEYLKKRKNMDRNLILKLVDRVEIHENKMVDLYLKIKPLEQVR